MHGEGRASACAGRPLQSRLRCIQMAQLHRIRRRRWRIRRYRWRIRRHRSYLDPYRRGAERGHRPRSRPASSAVRASCAVREDLGDLHGRLEVRGACRHEAGEGSQEGTFTGTTVTFGIDDSQGGLCLRATHLARFCTLLGRASVRPSTEETSAMDEEQAPAQPPRSRSQCEESSSTWSSGSSLRSSGCQPLPLSRLHGPDYVGAAVLSREGGFVCRLRP